MRSYSSLKILVVGTGTFYHHNLENMLTKIGFPAPEHADDGPSGWEAVKRLMPDIVVAQWDMPEMNGLALLKVIRSDPFHGETPVILCTNEITKSDVIKAGESGVNAILVEPLSIEVLEQKINLILEFDMTPSTKQARAYLEKGDRYMRAGLFDLALKEYERVLTILESAEVYYNIGYIKTARGEYDEALVAFRKATQINQLFAKAYQAMAEVYIKLGDKAMAEKYLNMAGEIFLEREMHEKAESVFNEIIALNPETTNVYNSLGILYRRQNRHADAVKVYQKAVKIDPEDENIHFNMGRAYLEMGQHELARQCFKKALELNPRFDTAQAMLKALESID
ncbi:MAG TPA: tetratricopeptide repeat protein [Deltaproteobacteria bacterium]|nr:tetratricopeptide repeat protein [Deltaproteobacteria bacterium]HOM30170.1 tetratricopeptide repeat protein [Deltaproteobacteria bacterium]HPP79395.1 tetratricopeptide repeat protein [Deltaproteobacteria bacterium]